MRSIRYMEVVLYKVVVKLFLLVFDFLHRNPLPKKATIQLAFSDLGLRLVFHI